MIQTFIAFEETPQSTILPNAAFGYPRAQVDHPLRLPGIDPERAYSPAEIKRIMAEREPAPDAPPVIRRIRKDIAPDPIAGLFARQIGGEQVVVEYEPDLDMRDIEQALLLSEDGVYGFMRRSILPYAPNAWHAPKTRKARLRNQLQPLLLQVRTPAHALRHQCRPIGVWTRRRGAAGGVWDVSPSTLTLKRARCYNPRIWRMTATIRLSL